MSSKNKLHLLEQGSFLDNAALRCGVEGSVITLHPKRQALMTPMRRAFYLATKGERATCQVCLYGKILSDETRQRMSAAKIGNRNAAKKPAPQQPQPYYGR